jgi:hypothetical protein
VRTIVTRVTLLAALAFAVVASAAMAAPRADQATPRTPIVLFPAFHFTKLLVTARNAPARAHSRTGS